MKSHKRSITSVLLQRIAHADVFEIGVLPTFLFILFGGSGMDEDEYERRGRSVIPIFDQVLGELAGRGINAVVVYVTAPYDVPFNRFADDPTAASTWKAHVLTELLEPWADLPYFLCGFSGGAALALNGLQDDPRCFGAAVLGADTIPPGFVCPGQWLAKLQLYSAPNDPVCSHPANRSVVDALKDRGQIEEFQLRSGRHRLADYSTAECLGELVWFSQSIAPS